MPTWVVRADGNGDFTSLEAAMNGLSGSTSPEVVQITEAFIDTTRVTVDVPNRSEINTLLIEAVGEAACKGWRCNTATPDQYLLKTSGQCISRTVPNTTIRYLNFEQTSTGSYIAAANGGMSCCISWDNQSNHYDFDGSHKQCVSIGAAGFGFRYNANNTGNMQSMVLNSRAGFGKSSSYDTGSIWHNCISKSDVDPYYRGSGTYSRANISSGSTRGDQSFASVEFLSLGDTPTGDYVAFKSVIVGSEDISELIDLHHETYINVAIGNGVNAVRDPLYEYLTPDTTSDLFGNPRTPYHMSIGPIEYVYPKQKWRLT